MARCGRNRGSQAIPNEKNRLELSSQILLAAAAGIRASELKGLRWRHIDFERPRAFNSNTH